MQGDGTTGEPGSAGANDRSMVAVTTRQRS